jgi:anti-sigma-K factor RskA
MMMMCNLSKDLKDSFVCYLMGELAPSEIAAIEKHLATGCESCRQEIAELENVLSSIACSVPIVNPSDNVRQKLISRVNAEMRVQPLKLVTPAKPWYKTPINLLGRIAASLAILMLLAETVYLLEFNKQARLQATLQEKQIQTLKEQIKQKQQVISSIGTSRRLIVLDSKLVSKASGKAFWDTNQNTWLIYISNLPNAPKGREYQLWFITDDQEVISGGMFQTDNNGCVQLPLATPHKCQSIREVAISLEPEGGSETPRGAIYLLGQV